MKKLFVWDFHGTLEKGNENASQEITNEVLAKHGYKQRLSDQDSIKLYGKKWYQYYEYLLPDEPHQKHLALQADSFEWPTAEAIVAKHMKPNDHAAEVVNAIRTKGHLQVLLSNTTEYALPIFVRLAGLSEYFDASNAFAIAAHSKDAIHTKVQVLEDFIQDHKLEHNLAVIGDSLSDMELAKREHAKGYYYRHPGLAIDKDLAPNVITIHDLRDVLAEVN